MVIIYPVYRVCSLYCMYCTVCTVCTVLYVQYVLYCTYVVIIYTVCAFIKHEPSKSIAIHRYRSTVQLIKGKIWQHLQESILFFRFNINANISLTSTRYKNVGWACLRGRGGFDFSSSVIAKVLRLLVGVGSVAVLPVGLDPDPLQQVAQVQGPLPTHLQLLLQQHPEHRQTI